MALPACSSASFRCRSDQRADLLPHPSIEARDRVKGEAPSESKGRPLGTYAGKLRERFVGAGNGVRVGHVLGGLLPPKVALMGRCFVGIHSGLASSRINLRGCERNGDSEIHTKDTRLKSLRIWAADYPPISPRISPTFSVLVLAWGTSCGVPEPCPDRPRAASCERCLQLRSGDNLLAAALASA
jgi:hypothetical protein